MNFELSDEICNQLIFAMEDQKDSFVFDSVDCIPVEKSSIQNFDTNRYYNLPVWGSIQGFRIMERFVSLLHNPLAREELRAVLFAGRGVFRNYKNVLKTYPEIERLWFSFKYKEMKSEIYRWYNVLRDSWGLEKIGDVPEEIDEELPAFFSFSPVKTKTDFEKLENSILLIERELSERFEGEIGKAIVCYWRTMRGVSSLDSQISLYAETVAEDFAGAITIVPYPEEAIQTVAVTSLFVLPEFRGLGLGKELINRCFEQLKKNGIRYIIMPNISIPETFVPALLRCGFTQNCGGFIADLI